MRHPHAQPKNLTTKQSLKRRTKPKLAEETAVQNISFKDEDSLQLEREDIDCVRAAVRAPHSPKDASPEFEIQRHSVELPPEILDQIFSYVAQFPSSQTTLFSLLLVSRSWYYAAIPVLYNSPRISGKNYDLFVRMVCPSINAHIRSNGLSELIKTLDMSSLVHNGSKSLTARLLGRVKGHLEVFVAPQASFA